MVSPLARSALTIAAAALLLSGCAGRQSGAAVATSSTDILRADEITRSGATDAFTAVRMLRPAFLQSRGRTSILRTENTEPMVYVDDRLIGGVASLRDIPANQVVEVRFFGPAQAQMRWGAGNSAGAILVRTGSAQRTPR
ncbi:MAG: hypothetical protein IT361_02170 [Gemmatimonadaceae bacterium]|nr:hypothetical protein [Gemmatimonadaceae bacterium]